MQIILRQPEIKNNSRTKCCKPLRTENWWVVLEKHNKSTLYFLVLNNFPSIRFIVPAFVQPPPSYTETHNHNQMSPYTAWISHNPAAALGPVWLSFCVEHLIDMWPYQWLRISPLFVETPFVEGHSTSSAGQRHTGLKPPEAFLSNSTKQLF